MNIFMDSISLQQTFERPTRSTLQLLFGAFRGFGRTLERDYLALLQSAHNHQVFLVAASNFDRLLHELLALLNVDGGFAVVCETRAYGDEQRVRLPFDR